MLKVLIANNLQLYFPHFLNLQMSWMIGLGYLLLYLYIYIYIYIYIYMLDWVFFFFFFPVMFQIFS
jgi:hypothetical protein